MRFADGPDPFGIEILVMPDTTLIEVAAVIEPLRAANRLAGRRLYDWRIVTPDGAPATTQAGVPVPATAAFAAEGGAPLLVLASYEVERHATRALTARIARAGRARPAVIGVEAGSWLMARAGLLDGRRATTHWEDLEAFATAFPAVEVVPARHVVDGDRVTTGGAGPALDLMLEVIRHRQGYGLALEVAKAFIYEPAARPEQAPALAFARPREPRLARALGIMEAHMADPLPVERIARQAGVSPRHLQGLFHTHLGTSPAEHYRALRLALARRLLIETTRPALEIAAAAGFASAASFARAYRRLHGESPSETRRRAREGAGDRAAE
jgi:transcriptional regulator GlxA family with amidase domain